MNSPSRFFVTALLHGQAGNVQAMAVLPLRARLIVERQFAQFLQKLRTRLIRGTLQLALVQLVQRRVPAIPVAHSRRMTQHVLERRLAMRRFNAPGEVATFISFNSGK